MLSVQVIFMEAQYLHCICTVFCAKFIKFTSLRKKNTKHIYDRCKVGVSGKVHTPTSGRRHVAHAARFVRSARSLRRNDP